MDERTLVREQSEPEVDEGWADLVTARGPAATTTDSSSGTGVNPPVGRVPVTLHLWAGWSWRLVAIAAALWVVGQVAGTFTFVLIALFVALVMSSLVLPLVNQLARVIPRALAVAVSLVTSAAKQVALHPLVIILSVTAGGVSAGIVVAVPVVSVLWVITRYATGRDPEHPLPPNAPTAAPRSDRAAPA